MEAWELDELIALLDVQQVERDLYRAESFPARLRAEDAQRAMVEGSQILGQALVAASRAESDRFVKSAHMIFARPAGAALPLDLELERIQSGRSFSSLSVSARQNGRLCARGLFLLDAGAPDCIRHAAPLPETASPEDAEAFPSLVDGRELRIAEGADYADPDATGPPTLDVWVRHARAPEDQALRQALLAQLCGAFTIGTSMRPHAGYGEKLAHRTLSTGVLSLTIHFHVPTPLEGWLLYAHESTHTGRGLCDGGGRVFERDGTLLASFAQDGLLRPLPAEVAAERGYRDVL